jgi:hypothetical protein
MKSVSFTAFGLLVAVVTAAASTDFIYRFTEYPATDKYRGRPAAVNIKTAGDRMYRTVLREAAAKVPDFAGHYKVATWGCGSGCITYAIIDSNSGEILQEAGGVVSRSCKQDDSEKILNYRLDSRLLIINGNLDDENLGIYYYELRGKKLLLLKETPHPRKDASCY